MSYPDLNADILIVGAGPVGLFLANECARRNLRYRIVEARAGQSQHSKALAVFPRTLEVFDMGGLVSPFVEQANRVTSAEIVTHGKQLAQIRFQPDETPYSFVAMVPQDATERFLLEALRSKGGDVEYETEFVSAQQHDEFVRVTLQGNDGQEEISAAFVVGCDGAHSTVRHSLNIPFKGAPYEALFLLADIETSTTLPADAMHLCPNEAGPLAIFPMSATRRRIVAMIDQPEGENPSLELVQRLLKQRGPAGSDALELYWSSYFKIHHRVVSRLRDRRIFLAGDSAHIHSPFGGQGMNTGLQDVWNLSWKLDLYLRGLGNEELLDSYTAERLPVINHVIDVTHMMTKVMATPNRLAQSMRNAIIPVVSRLVPFQHAFVQTLSELGVAYPGSPIVEGPGKRFFHDSIRGGNGIRDRFLLYFDDTAAAPLKNTVASLCESHEGLLELRSWHDEGFMLVRPDGYIAAEGRDLSELASIDLLLDRQTKNDANQKLSRAG